MKNRKLLTFLPFLMMCFLISAMINWWFDMQDQHYMQDLLLHQRINPDEIIAITWQPSSLHGEKEMHLDEDKQRQLTELFNTYPATYMKVLHPKEEMPQIEQRITIELHNGSTITVNRGNEQIWISRSISEGNKDNLRYIIVENERFISLFDSLHTE